MSDRSRTILGFGTAFVVSAVVAVAVFFAMHRGDPASEDRPDYVQQWRDWCTAQGGRVMQTQPSESCLVDGTTISYVGEWPTDWYPPQWSITPEPS